MSRLPRMRNQSSELDRVERRKRMNFEELLLDIYEELRDKARYRNILYMDEIAKPRPRRQVLFQIWTEHSDDMWLAVAATPPGEVKDGFNTELKMANSMIERLSKPNTKVAIGLGVGDEHRRLEWEVADDVERLESEGANLSVGELWLIRERAIALLKLSSALYDTPNETAELLRKADEATEHLQGKASAMFQRRLI